MKKSKQICFIAIVLVFLYLPIIVLITYSFNDAKYALTFSQLSLRWYKVLFADINLWYATLNSLFLALTSATLATSLALFQQVYGYINHKDSKLNQFASNALLTLVVIPDIVFAAALLIFFKLIKLPLGFYSLFIAHVCFSFPFALIVIKSQLDLTPRLLLDAAIDLGKTPQVFFYKILLPLITPGIFASFLLCFTLSFDDVLISYFVSGPNYEILSLHVYSLIRTGITPEINALCAMIFIFSMSLVLIAQALMRKKPCV